MLLILRFVHDHFGSSTYTKCSRAKVVLRQPLPQLGACRASRSHCNSVNGTWSGIV